MLADSSSSLTSYNGETAAGGSGDKNKDTMAPPPRKKSKQQNLYDFVYPILEATIKHDVSNKLVETWVPSKLWYDACRYGPFLKRYGEGVFGGGGGDDNPEFKHATFMSCLTKHTAYNDKLEIFDATENKTGIYKRSVGKKVFLFVTRRSGFVPDPPFANSHWAKEIETNATKIATSLERYLSLRSSGRLKNEDDQQEQHNDDDEEEDEVGDDEEDDDARHSHHPDGADNQTVDIGGDGAGGMHQEQQQQQKELVFSYWESSEARKLFGSKLEDVDTRETLLRKIERLATANEETDGHKELIEGGDKKNECTPTDIRNIKQRSLILCCAYKTALEYMGRAERPAGEDGGRQGREGSSTRSGPLSFTECIHKVLGFFKGTGINQAVSPRIVQRWNNLFRSRELWAHPRGPPGVRSRSDPPLFQLFPEAKTSIVEWCHSNIRDLSCEKLHAYIHDTLIPERLLPRWREMRAEIVGEPPLPDDVNEQRVMFLKAYGLTQLSLRTVLVWMHHLGMKYANRSKSFYVDGHERPDVIESRINFVFKYLREWEPYCHRFVRLTSEDLARINILESECIAIEDVETDTTLFEVHEDRLWHLGNDAIQAEFDAKERQQSIRREDPTKKRLIIIGQDECIFHQYLLNQKAWIGPNGEQSIDPKTIGEGFMISAFKSRDLGFGHRPFSEEDALKINRYRENKTYIDKEAARTILGSDDKNRNEIKAGRDTPFLQYLLIGKSNEGYWSSAHMAVQFEDVVDCCKALYGDAIDFLFLFDHSCGHDRRPPGALDAKAMNASYGGNQPVFNPSKIEAHEGYLGNFYPLLRPGDMQSFVFGPEDEGPYYLTQLECEQKRHDKDNGGLLKRRLKTAQELALELVQGLHVLERNLPKTAKELCEKAVECNIPVEVLTRNVTQGWEGKPKGLRQVCWERGLLDPTIRYTRTMLVELLEQCVDFENAESNLQMIARELGVVAERTPKFHCELAGEGIEYDWALMKKSIVADLFMKRREDNISSTLFAKLRLGSLFRSQ